MKKFSDARLGQRIRFFREKSGTSQRSLAAHLGMSDRQTISEIERGGRRITADELIKLSTLFGVSMEQLTNPFLLASDKAMFSWRQSCVAKSDLDAFELHAGEWIGAFRELHELNGERLRAILPRLSLTHKSAYEEAISAGDAVATELELGDKPSVHLADVAEKRLGILVLMVDAIPGVSGAACRLPQLNAILINRHESEVRRNFDLAHELFHLLTWDKMPPEWVEDAEEDKSSYSSDQTTSQKRVVRIEQLANVFASGLLIPNRVVEKLTPPSTGLAAWLVAAAAELGVSKHALKYRLINAKVLSKNAGEGCDFSSVPRRSGESTLPPAPFSKTFISTMALAIAGGHLSARRAAALLDMTVDELGEVCESHEVERPAELS